MRALTRGFGLAFAFLGGLLTCPGIIFLTIFIQEAWFHEGWRGNGTAKFLGACGFACLAIAIFCLTRRGLLRAFGFGLFFSLPLGFLFLMALALSP